MSDTIYKSLDALMGEQDEKIFKLFGRPALSLNGFVLFYKSEQDNILAMTIKGKPTPEGLRNLVDGVILFSEEGELLHRRNIRLLDDKTVREAQNALMFKQAQEILGEAATDIGSGRQILIYFTERAQILTLRTTVEEKPKMTLLPLIGKEAKF